MERWVETIADKWRESILRHNWGDEKRFNPPWLSGSNTLLRKRAWEEVGGFWERLKRSGDDTNIWSRLKKKGYFPIYEPKAIVWHHRRDTIPSVLRAWWNWNNTPQREHFYRNLGKLVEKIELNFKIGSHNFKFHLAQEEVHLLYVDFLLPFFATLLDIKNYTSLRITGRRGLSFSSEIELVRALYTVVFNEMIYQLKRYGLPPNLIEKMESDLSSIELDEYEEAKKEGVLEDTDPQSAIKKFKEAIDLIVGEYLSKIQGSVDLIVISSRMK
jgi:cellulose synthase/poly-beta-1,6-N-acetylglucosamine synthase-like glycosyltransferase